MERGDTIERSPAATSPRRPRIVIIGAGFGGLTAAMRLRGADADVTVVDHLASQPDWPSGGDVLEVGCGAGWFWAGAALYVPPGLRVQLTDISFGMVQQAVIRARENGHWNQVEGCVADASSRRKFDAVLASHMIYHVPDPRAALGQIERILRSSGAAVIATNGISNMRELFDLRRAVFGVQHDQVSAAFALENDRPMVEAVFATVQLRKYPDVPVCTEPRDVMTI